MESVLSYGFLALPTVLITLSLVGALAALRWRRAGLALTLAASLLLFAAATPFVASVLMRRVEAGLPPPEDFRAAQAIVVLGGDQRYGDGRGIPDALGPLSMERVAFAAAAYHKLHLPVLVTGGRTTGAHQSGAALLKAALEGEFAIPVKWTEDRSHTTWENAAFSAPLLRAAGIDTIVLVSQSFQLPRAIWCFERQGLRALAWPAPRTAWRLQRPGDLLPSIGALQETFYAAHELIGGLYYRLRH